MDKELAEMIEENGIVYHLAKDGCYYPDVRLPGGDTLQYREIRTDAVGVSARKLQK